MWVKWVNDIKIVMAPQGCQSDVIKIEHYDRYFIRYWDSINGSKWELIINFTEDKIAREV